jgi:glycosyltransferase involved in cell wall biosynthesis
MRSATPVIDAVSTYGLRAGSPRVRLADWFDHEGLVARWHTYAGTSDVRPGTMLRHPLAVGCAELAVRRQVRADILTLSREASPWSLGGVEEALLARAGRGVYDVDDAIFDDPSPVRRLMRFERKWKRMLGAADVVIAGNDYLAERASRDARDVRMIPSCVEPGDYLPKDSWALGELPVLVWLGSPATEHFVVELIEPLTRLHQRTGARLRLISGSADNPALAPMAHLLDRVPWDPATVASALAGADVALGPLDDSPYARGKCAYKLLQYAATGLPVVASPVGANDLALTRFDGVAVGAADDWAEAVEAVLAEGEERRRRRGEQGLRAVNEHYSFASWSASWRAAVLGEESGSRRRGQ